MRRMYDAVPHVEGVSVEQAVGYVREQYGIDLVPYLLLDAEAAEATARMGLDRMHAALDLARARAAVVAAGIGAHLLAEQRAARTAFAAAAQVLQEAADGLETAPVLACRPDLAVVRAAAAEAWQTALELALEPFAADAASLPRSA